MSLLKEILSIPLEGRMEDLLRYWQQDTSPVEEPVEFNDKGFAEIFDDTETTAKPSDLFPLLDDLLDEDIQLEDLTASTGDLGDFFESFGKTDVDNVTYPQPDVLSTDFSNFLVDNLDMSGVSTPPSPAVSLTSSLDSPEPIQIDHSPSEPGMYVELDSDSDQKPKSELEAVLTGVIVPSVSAIISPAPEPVRFAPYRRPPQKTASKKERKRLQNQQAAVRYRQKKKQETDTIQKEEFFLREENAKLTEKVSGLEKEIKYIKDLLVEVYKAKGLIKQAKQLKHL